MTGDLTPDLNRTALSDAVRRLSGPVFAVIDGSWFHDLPRLLAAADLRHRSLFREQSDPDSLLSGPWLVHLSGSNRENEIERLLKISGIHPAVVFWSCSEGEAALHRHLRSINEVLIPPQRDLSEPGSRGDGEQRVLFRHWDPRVLASIAPMLDEGQAARLLGPAEGIALDSGYGRGVGTITRPQELPATSLRALHFTSDQITALDDEHIERFRWETVTYLRDHCPDQTACLDDPNLYRVVYSAEFSAHRFGLRDGPDLRRWAWLWVMTEGDVGTDADVQTFMRDPVNGSTPSERLDRLWEEILQGFDELERSSEKR